MAEQINLEDEMSRFEQEISGGFGPPAAAAAAPLIGANTFTSVQDQLASLRAQVYGGSNASQHSENPPLLQPDSGNVRQQLTAPPRPPGFKPPQINSDAVRAMSGPPSRMQPPGSFLPPQLRMSAPASQQENGLSDNSSGASQGHPSGMLAGQPSTLTGQPVRYNTPVVEAPRIVYSSKPVLNKPRVAAPIEPSVESKPLKREAPIALASGPSTSLKPAQHSDAFNDDSGHPSRKKNKVTKEKKFVRTAANDVWEDQSLADWDPNDFRVFCGDLGNEVTDEKLAEAFKKYPSLQKAKVIRDKRTHKTKGYGFISFKDPTDYTRAMREMNGKYVGNRPIKLRKSNWRDRNIEVVKKKEKEKKKLGFR